MVGMCRCALQTKRQLDASPPRPARTSYTLCTRSNPASRGQGKPQERTRACASTRGLPFADEGPRAPRTLWAQGPRADWPGDGFPPLCPRPRARVTGTRNTRARMAARGIRNGIGSIGRRRGIGVIRNKRRRAPV